MTEKLAPGIERFIRLGSIVVLMVSLAYMILAMVSSSGEGEAPIGSFRTEDFNDGWTLLENGQEIPLRIPTALDRREGEEIVITNTLPQDLSDGMNLMLRATMEDVMIYVDGRLRAQYSSDGIDGMSFYIPSAYVVAGLDRGDSGKEIRIELRVKTQGVVNGVRIGHGNNVWFEVIQNGLSVSMISIAVFLAGVVLMIAVLVFQRYYRVSAARQLSLLMMNTAMWVFSESTLRQLVFSKPSMTQYFAYFVVELIAVLGLSYFDEVQHRVYHRHYIMLEAITFLQILINAILHIIGFMPFYKTLMISHIWAGITAVVGTSGIIADIIEGRVKEYKITVVGMICFVVLGLSELVGFYVDRFHNFGTNICIGLLLLMLATVVQTIYDEVMANRARVNARTDMIIKTIQTIAGAIDARDEYTGGHSERVGYYAGCLAEEMAEKYGLDAVDIMRIRYIGLVHDIGKIGVADNVLNKSGKLTEEEYSLMKNHAEIGFEMMSSMKDSIPGLLDGIHYHHERYDGKGYPEGLKGKQIPLVARILALCDSYDAMTSNRVYRRRLTEEAVREEIRSCAGSQFDPDLAEIFLQMLEKGNVMVRTVDGLATDEKGEVRTSSKLDCRLQRDLQRHVPVMEPSHVRMLCYAMKLMEKKEIFYEVVFFAIDTEVPDGKAAKKEMEILRGVLMTKADKHDITIQYTPRQIILAIYNGNREMAEQKINEIRAEYPALNVEFLEEDPEEKEAGASKQEETTEMDPDRKDVGNKKTSETKKEE